MTCVVKPLHIASRWLCNALKDGKFEGKQEYTISKYVYVKTFT